MVLAMAASERAAVVWPAVARAVLPWRRLSFRCRLSFYGVLGGTAWVPLEAAAADGEDLQAWMDDEQLYAGTEDEQQKSLKICF